MNVLENPCWTCLLYSVSGGRRRDLMWPLGNCLSLSQIMQKRQKVSSSSGGHIPQPSGPVLSLTIDMEVIIVSLTWLLSQCVGPVDWTYPNHYLLCEEKYCSITLYASVNQTQSFPSVTLIDVESCMAYLSSTTPSWLILYKKVRMHMMLGLLRPTKSLCCSWSFVVLPSSAAVTELRKLCSGIVRNHYNFTTWLTYVSKVQMKLGLTSYQHPVFLKCLI